MEMTAGYRHGADYFEVVSFVGGTSDRKIYNVRYRNTGEPLIMHVLPKQHVEKCNASLVVENGKIPFTVNLRYTFQTQSRYYLILDSVKEDRRLSRYHDAQGAFDTDDVVFVLAEILLAISQFHAYFASYGSINLNHVYLDITGHVKLKRDPLVARYWLQNECFGCRKAGTCLYHREARVEQEAVAKDWADLGKLMCVLFGDTTGYEDRPDLTVLPENAVSLLKKLSNWRRSPFTAAELKGHDFFSKVNWQKAENHQLTPPERFIRTPLPGLSTFVGKNSDDEQLNQRLLRTTELKNNGDSLPHQRSLSNNQSSFITGQSSLLTDQSSISAPSFCSLGPDIHAIESKTASLNPLIAETKQNRSSETSFRRNGLQVEKWTQPANVECSFIENNNYLEISLESSNSYKRIENIGLSDDLGKDEFDKNVCYNINGKSRAEYYPDDVTFVTVESLEKSFHERLQRSKAAKSKESSENAEMSYQDFSGRFSDLVDSNKDIPAGLSAEMLTETRDQPLLSSLYNSFGNDCSTRSRYIMDYDSMTDDRVKEKLWKYSETKRSDINENVFQTNGQYAKKPDSVLLQNELAYTDVNSKTAFSGCEEKRSIPPFTRSNSYQSGFPPGDFSRQRNAEDSPSIIERANELINSMPKTDKYGTDSNNDASIFTSSYMSPVQMGKAFNGNLKGRNDHNSDNELNGIDALHKRLSRSLVNLSSNEADFETEQDVTRSKVDAKAKQFVSLGASQNVAKEEEEEKFVRDYLNRSFPPESRTEAENDAMKTTWPVGYNSTRSLTETGRSNSSLVQRILDNDALQRIRQGAYLQSKKDFQLPTKRSLSSTKSVPLEKPSSPVEQGNLARFTSLDEGFSTLNEEKAAYINETTERGLRDGRGALATRNERRNHSEYQTLNSPSEMYTPRKAWGYDITGSTGYAQMSGFGNAVGTSYPGLAGYSMVAGRTGLIRFRSDMSDKYESSMSGRDVRLSKYLTDDDHVTQNHEIRRSKITDDGLMETEDLTQGYDAMLQDAQMEVMEEMIGQTKIDDVFLANDSSLELNKETNDKENIAKTKPKKNSGQDASSSRKKRSKDTGNSRHKDKTNKSNVDSQSIGNSVINISSVEENKDIEGVKKKSDADTRNGSHRTRRQENTKKVTKFDDKSNYEEAESHRNKPDDMARSPSEETVFCDKNDEKGLDNNDQKRDEMSDGKGDEGDANKANKKNNRSVSFHETTKKPDGPSKSAAVTPKTQSDSYRPSSSLGKSMKDKDLNIEILPNPKTHRGSHRRLRSVEEQETLKIKDKINQRKSSLDSSINQYHNETVGVNDLVDRLRVISESGRSARTSPSLDRRSIRGSPVGSRRRMLSSENEIDRSNSIRKMIKPKITVQNSTPRSMSPVSDEIDGHSSEKKTRDIFSISRESSIGSASDLWLDEDDVKNFGRKIILCRRSASTSSAVSAESVEYFRAKYGKSPTLTSNSSEDEVNNRDTDKQSYNSGKSIDSGLSDIFETSKEDCSLTANRSRCSAISKSDSGVLKDMIERRTSQSDDVFDDGEPIMKGSESMCPHCNSGLPGNGTEREEMTEICKKCHKKKVERKEAIVELIQTEINYGQDLRILKEEFYAPIKNGGVLSSDNVNAVFLNLQELIDVNSKLCITLQGDLEECITRDDQELESLEVGRVFLENVEFFQAYEVFCTKQRQAAELVESLQKKSELLRIFLQVSCKQNSKLRKMDLKSFLTMPVQRIMKYPLLLTRIYRATLRGNSDREALIHARRKIEEQIAKINEIASGRPAKLRKSKSTSALNQQESKGHHLTRLVAEILDWKLEETQIVLSDAFELSCCELINFPNWSTKLAKKPCKVQLILCLYGVLEQLQLDTTGGQCGSNNRSEATNAAVIILKQKSAHRYSLFKEPIMLSQAVISEREDVKVAFEISPIGKECLTLIVDDAVCCTKWLRSLKHYAKDLGQWRARRNAMANIMIKSMS